MDIYLQRGALHAPNHWPDDGLEYKTIHNFDLQKDRKTIPIPCGPCGVIHDYVPFYFGYLSPMLLQLKTGQVKGYTEGQEPLIYLVSTVETVVEAKVPFVFSDGHGRAFNTDWYDKTSDLDKVDWNMVYQRYWAADYDRDIDRQRRKQAEFLVYKKCDWSLIHEIGVLNSRMKSKVEQILSGFDPEMNRPVHIKSEWYY
jgi:hypothetical protein